jgi:hypothetical protein
MPRFFVPGRDDQQRAAEDYAAFADSAAHPIAHVGSRLFRISFERDGRMIVAQIGAPPQGWPDPLGPVVAIIETTRVVYVHVTLRPGGPSAFPLLVSPDAVLERVYFDDYPRR